MLNTEMQSSLTSADVAIRSALEKILAHFHCENQMQDFLNYIDTGDSLTIDQLAETDRNVKNAKEVVERAMSHALKSVSKIGV